jgi:ubiquinone biosynthesis protein COQ4
MRPTNHPLVALRALLELARDPDDLPKVFKIIEALPGRSAERILARMTDADGGRRLVATRPDLGAVLSDRAALAARPAGSLGRAYFDFTERARIDAQGIVAASTAERATPLAEGDLRFVGERMRDSHDLWHVVTGYGTDVLGELALLAFTYAQAPQPGIGLIVGFAYLQFAPGVNELLRDAHRRGKAAAWLPAIAWEELLDQPVDAVRAQLRVPAPPAYTPITSAELRSGGPVVKRFWTRTLFGARA